MHRGVVLSRRVLRVRILVRPKGPLDPAEQLADTSQARLQELPRLRVRLRDEVDLRAVSAHHSQVRLSGLRIDHTDEAQPMIEASLSQTDPHVAGAGFDHHAAWLESARAQGVLKNAQRWTILDTPARIQPLQFGKELKAALRDISPALDL